MDGLEIDNWNANTKTQRFFDEESRGFPGIEENARDVPVREMASKAKVKAKRSKKNRKTATEDIGTQEAEGNGSVENILDTYKSADAANDGLDNHNDNEVMLENLPRPRRAKKVSDKVLRRQKTPKLPAAAESEEYFRYEDEDEVEPVNLLDVAKRPKYVPGPQNPDSVMTEPDLVTGLRNTNAKLVLHDKTVPEDLPQLPQKTKKSKRVKAQRHSNGLSTMSQEDVPSLDEGLHQSLTPAHVSHYSIEIPHKENREESSRLGTAVLWTETAASDHEREVKPQPPSEKALGKRKAVADPEKQTSKKRIKKASNQAVHGQDLRKVFKPQQNSDEASRVQCAIGNTNLTTSISRRLSNGSKRTVKGRPDDDTQADRDGSDGQTGRDTPEELAQLPFEAALLGSAEIRKRRKRRLPVDEDEGSPSNRSRRTTRPKSEASQAKTPKTPKSNATPKGTTAASSSTSRLTVDDTAAISDAIESYREFNDMSQYQINELIQRSAQSEGGKALWKSVFDEIPLLPRRNVVDFCRRKFHNFEGRGVWTEEQDEELRAAYEKNPNKWKAIGIEINRFPEDARDRWRNYLVCGDSMRTDVWDKHEEKLLKTAVEECIQAIRAERRTGADLSTLAEERLIDWQKVSEKMNRTRSRLQCSYKWKKLKAIKESDEEDPKVNAPISQSWRLEDAKIRAGALSANEKLRLLRAIRDCGASREGKIPWGSISLDLNEKGKRMAWKVCFRELKDKLPNHREMKFKEIVQSLVDIFDSSAPEEPPGFDIDPVPVSKKRGKPKRKAKAKDDEDGAPEADNGAGSSRITKTISSNQRPKYKPKAKVRGQEDDVLDANDGGGPPTSATVKRKFRDHMRRQDESTPETTDAVEGVMTDAHDDMVASLHSLKADNGNRWPETKRKSKSKPKKFLSEEKVVEDPSDEEGVANDHIDEEETDSGHNRTDVATSDPLANVDVKVEVIDTQTHDTESVNLDDDTAITANGFDDSEDADQDADGATANSFSDTGSVDLDEDHNITAIGFDSDEGSDHDEDEAATAKSSDGGESFDLDESYATTSNRFDDDNITDISTHLEDGPIKTYHSLANRHVDNYFGNAESDSDSVSSSDNSSIPPKVDRKMSIEL
jgi:hypothetical protein